MGRYSYGLIIILSLLAGTLSASLLQSLHKVKRQTIFYTAFLDLFATGMCSMLLVFLRTLGKGYGFSGLGAAFGLMLGNCISVYIHNDKPGVVFSSWVVSAPLMYSISKMACFSSGCCEGDVFGYPVQPVMSAVFFIVYVISLIAFFMVKDKMKACALSMVLSFIARFGMDFFHYSHIGKAVSAEQILVLVAGTVAFILYALRSKLPLPREL